MEAVEARILAVYIMELKMHKCGKFRPAVKEFEEDMDEEKRKYVWLG